VAGSLVEKDLKDSIIQPAPSGAEDSFVNNKNLY
jgi:hypothetical protein